MNGAPYQATGGPDGTRICGTKREADEDGQACPYKRKRADDAVEIGNCPYKCFEILGRQWLVLLDTGANAPMIDEATAREQGIPLIKKARQSQVLGFNNKPEPDAGVYYTNPIPVTNGKHTSMVAFDTGPIGKGNAILPGWWMREHGLKDPYANPLEFTGKDCATKCSEPHLPTTHKAVRMIQKTVASADTPEATLPTKWAEFQDITSANEEAVRRLPPHKPYDHAIVIRPGEKIPWGPIYGLSIKELDVLKKWLDEMLADGKIRRSQSSAGSPILFVPKKDGSLRLCVDYRALNKVTVPNRYPIPVMAELQDRVQGATVFTKLDLKSGYHLIRIKEGDEWKTAFRCRYGLFEFTVMPFGLTNAPATFQDLMNHIFRDLLDHGVVVYLDDILIYAQSLEEHDKIVRKVLERLREHNLVLSLEKSVWEAYELEFLGFIISTRGIGMAEGKTDSVRTWLPS